jgi:hypothetical protein
MINIGQDSDNQGIVALATREGRSSTELFVRVANFADEPADLLVEILVDGGLFDARDVSLPAYPDGSTSLTFTGLPEAATHIEARLSQNDDLNLDNAATTTRRSSEGRILLVSQGNLFLERAFSLIPGLTLTQITPDNYPTQDEYDLTIFDRNVPNALADGNTLFIAPPASTALFTVQGTFSNTALIGQQQTNHPIMRFVELANLNIAQAQSIEPPPWTSSLLNGQGGSLLIAGENEGRRIAVITFDLLRSDLPLQIDFPILIANLAGWFLDQPPIDAAPAESEALNLLNFEESNIRPAQADIQGAAPDQAGSTDSLQGQQEFWWILVVLALIILVWEWQVYWRGTG